MRRNNAARRTILLAAALALAAAGCSSSSSSSSSGATGSTPAAGSSSSAGAATVDTSSCGSKPGVKATGTPIPLGAIATNQPGTSFTDIPNMAKAYFDCVNANGGINGHPIKLFIATEQTNPAQIAADAKQLVQTDKVVGIVGSTSIIECSINSSYWQKLGFYVIDSGIAPECYSTRTAPPSTWARGTARTGRCSTRSPSTSPRSSSISRFSSKPRLKTSCTKARLVLSSPVS